MFDIINHLISYERKDVASKELAKHPRLLLIQEKYPRELIGKRAGEGIYTGESDRENLEELRVEIRKIIARISPNIDLVVLSEHPGNAVSLDLFQKQADESKQIIIARLGYYDHGEVLGIRNSVAVVVPDQKQIFVDEISLSIEDQQRNKKGNLQRGEVINLLNTPLGKIAVLNCFDYTNADILAQLIDEDIEILIALTFNPGSRLYSQYALADMHRFFCFVVISNIANYGGSGVFAPFRRKGPKSGSLSLGGTLAFAKGECTAYLKISLPIGELRQSRKVLSSPGSIESKKRQLNLLPIIVPGETFLAESLYKNNIQKHDFLKNVKLENYGYEPYAENGKINIGVAHLKSMNVDDYVDNLYHISASEKASLFIKGVRGHLHQLSTKLNMNEEKLDFLVFPEVFLPLGLESDLENFAQKYNTIIICGVEYDRQPIEIQTLEDSIGTNRCFIYIPTISGQVHRFEYMKLTRSEYDARTPPKNEGEDRGKFKMNIGEHLFRFSHPDIGQFGILICYDYSHFDILHKLNRQGIKLPPELLFVISYNPDSNLYESCCIADSHRFYQYIIMCNVAQFGGSGVFGPVKTQGLRQTLLKTGVGSEGISVVSVDLYCLREARKTNDLQIITNMKLYKKYRKLHEKFQNKPGIFQDDGT